MCATSLLLSLVINLVQTQGLQCSSFLNSKCVDTLPSPSGLRNVHAHTGWDSCSGKLHREGSGCWSGGLWPAGCSQGSMALLPQNGGKVFAMRHQKRIAKLGRPADQRKALVRSLTTEVLRHGRITTTKVSPLPPGSLAPAHHMHACRVALLIPEGHHLPASALGWEDIRRIQLHVAGLLLRSAAADLGSVVCAVES